MRGNFAKCVACFAEQWNTEHFENQQLKREAAVDFTLPDKGFWRKVDVCFAKKQNIQKVRMFRKTFRLFCIPVFCKTIETKRFKKWQNSEKVKRFMK
jgi:hypothetical protein